MSDVSAAGSSKLCADNQNQMGKKRLRDVRRLWTVSLAALLLAGLTARAQKPLTVKPDAPGLAVNHRLILKDGTYQLVRKYEIVGDRVRYISLERGGDWE